MLFTLLLLATAFVEYSYTSQYGNPTSYGAIYSQPTAYTASYGPYHAEIKVNDPLTRPDFDNTKCGGNCWGTSGYNHQQRAYDRAQEVQDAQREAFWAQ